MAIQLSVVVRNARLDAIETAIGASAILKVRTGAVPANCAAADSGTVLATVNLPADWMDAVVPEVIHRGMYPMAWKTTPRQKKHRAVVRKTRGSLEVVAVASVTNTGAVAVELGSLTCVAEALLSAEIKIGRASCRERVLQVV